MKCLPKLFIIIAVLLTAFPAVAQYRTILSANLTQFVSTTGSDSTGDGSSGNPWATCAHAYNIVQNTLDLHGFGVTCSMAVGTYTGVAQTFNGPLVGSVGPASFVVTGVGTTTVIDGATSANAFTVNNGAAFTLQNLTLTPGLNGFGIVVQGGSIELTNLSVTASGIALVDTAGPYSVVLIVGAITLNAGNGFAAPLIAEDLSEIFCAGTWTLNGTPSWTNGFVQADLGAMIDGTGFTFNGTATGPRYNVASNAIVFTGGSGGASFYPGSIAGSINTGGFYQ